MNSTIPLGRIAGVRVGLNWSVLVIAWLLSWSLASAQLPEQVPGRTDAEYWIAGTLAAVGFIAAILAHELGHALMARRFGVDTDEITLWMFGGVAKLKSFGKSPKSELQIALAGPAVSTAVAAAALVAAAVVEATTESALATEALRWLGVINIVLVAFNLLPAAPLDGGRVLSSILWRRWRDERRAHQASAAVGRSLGSLMVGFGVLSLVVGGAIGGLWIVLLGWFLLGAADAEYTTWELKSTLGGRAISDVMSSDPVTVMPELRLDRFVDTVATAHRHAAYPVVDATGRPIGLVTLKQIANVPRADWSNKLVLDVASPLADVHVVSSDAPLVEAMGDLNTKGGGRLLVVDEGRLVGIVSPSDIARLLEVEALHHARA